MKTAAFLRYLPVFFALLLGSGGQALAQTDAERIRVLEERVAHLERMVDALTQARDASENNTRRLIAGFRRRTGSSRTCEHACFHDAQFRTAARPRPAGAAS
jgi:hypothetical protein